MMEVVAVGCDIYGTYVRAGGRGGCVNKKGGWDKGGRGVFVWYY